MDTFAIVFLLLLAFFIYRRQRHSWVYYNLNRLADTQFCTQEREIPVITGPDYHFLTIRETFHPAYFK